MNNQKKLGIFVLSFIFALLFWRIGVLLKNGGVSILREITGLTVHHYHYGVFLILVSALLLIFYKKNNFSVGLMGFGLGSVLDSFVSGLIKLNTVRSVEITRYNQSFSLTVLIFLIVIMLSMIFYAFSGKINKSKI